MTKIGILAYGSLIDDPGKEIDPLIIDKVKCKTPFKVEYARKSRTRSNCPTLIPCDNIGKSVNAVILVLKEDTALEDAKNLVWRRETGNIDSEKKYTHDKNPSANKVQINEIGNFKGIETVLYTSIGKNIEGEIDAEKLSELAINSILKIAGKNKKDGIRYLLKNKQNNIVTQYSLEYENLILAKTESESLEDAIIKLDKKRES